MQVQLENVGPCTVKLEVEVDAAEVSGAFAQAWREAGRAVRVPGFRPGKAPRNIVEQFADRDRVRERARDIVLLNTGRQALDEKQLTPNGDPHVDAGDMVDNEPYKWSAVVELDAIVKLGPVKGLTARRPVVEVTEADVDAVIQRMRESNARLADVTGRSVEAGDTLVIDATWAQEGGEPEPQRRQLAHAGSGSEPFLSEIIGMAIGETRTFAVPAPDSTEGDASSGKSGQVTVTLHRINAPELPAVDDAFALKVAGVETVAALRETISANLIARNQRTALQAVESDLLSQIIESSEIQYPEGMVTEQALTLARHLDRDLQQNGSSLEAYLQQNNLDVEGILQRLRPSAEQRLRSVLVCNEIAKANGIEVGHDEVDERLTEMVEQERIPSSLLSGRAAANRLEGAVSAGILTERIRAFLLNNNTVVDAEPVTERAGEAAGGQGAETESGGEPAADSAPASTEAEDS